jgi:hypothetical protein
MGFCKLSVKFFLFPHASVWLKLKGVPMSTFYAISGSQNRLADAPRTGDICTLLVPNYSQSSLVRDQLETLRGRFGGTVTFPLHVICQRFRADTEQLETLTADLEMLAQTTQAINISGTTVEPFYSTFRSLELLKCRLSRSESLEKFIAALNLVLNKHRITPLNPLLPEWVTLIENIQMGRLQKHPYDQPLFVTCTW